MGPFKKKFKLTWAGSVTAIIAIATILSIGYGAGTYLTELDCKIKLNEALMQNNEKLIQEINNCRESKIQDQQASADVLKDIVEYLKVNKNGR